MSQASMTMHRPMLVENGRSPRAARLGLSLMASIAALFVGQSWARGDEPSALDFFESRIRPVLAARCHECHSAGAGTIEANLRVDRRDGLLTGGDSGPAIVPRRSNDSLLLRALRYEGPEMPPDAPLPPEVVADFARWIDLGSPFPEAADERAEPSQEPQPAAPHVLGQVRRRGVPIDYDAERRHWAYQPIARPTLETLSREFGDSAIDHIVGQRLAAAGLTPSPPADRRALARRLYFDLIGLPPTFERLERFAADDRPQAYAELVEELLASPQYGERWARHWLDVARYADTKDGVLMFGANRVRPYAYTYRDYCIRAFNQDLPFDEFVRDSLAADQRQPPVEPWRLAGMGMLTVGQLFSNNLPDIYDDQIDVVTRGFMGLTVACARCHDHKYDAIGQADYYALYGVFASGEAPQELPLIGQAEASEAAARFQSEDAPLRRAWTQLTDAEHQKQYNTACQRTADYLEEIVTKPPDGIETAVFFRSLSPDDLRPHIIARWRRYLAEHARADDPVFGLWHELLGLPSEGFASAARRVIESWTHPGDTAPPRACNPWVLGALAKADIRQPRDVARTYGALLAYIHESSSSACELPIDADDPARRQLLYLLTSPDGPVWFPRSHTYLYMARPERTLYHALQAQMDRLAATNAAAPPRAMVLVDAPEPHDPRIFVRGNPLQPGERVERGFLRVLSPNQPIVFRQGGGRLELAEAIVAADNPLTARVLANRVWMHHFGEPLVASPSDFGARSQPPPHLELLDWLAAELVSPTAAGARPWSLKNLHRVIVHSRTYRQASFDRPDARRQDPDNHLLWRQSRQRLDFEAMRDSMLAVSGQLDPARYGRAVDISHGVGSPRRTIYGLVDRQELPELFRVFDFATPDQTIERRPVTTTPQQALFAMNSPFVIAQARGVTAQADVASARTAGDRVRAIYRRVLSREPSADETRRARRFVAEIPLVADSTGAPLDAWTQLAQVLLASNEFLFVD